MGMGGMGMPGIGMGMGGMGMGSPMGAGGFGGSSPGGAGTGSGNAPPRGPAAMRGSGQQPGPGSVGPTRFGTKGQHSYHPYGR